MGLPLLRGTAEYADCASCPFARDGRPNNPVFAEYPKDPAFLLVGEWPGRNEVVLRRPMVGETGQTVTKVLSTVGRTRDQVLITNATLCLPSSDNPSARDQAARACNPRLKMELHRFPGKPILTMGNTAARAIIPQAAFDAIDSPETKPSHKKKQKERQQAIDKGIALKEKRREALAEKLIRKFLKQWNPKAKRETVAKFEPKVLTAIETRAYREADEELERKELAEAARRAATPRKQKPIGISAIAGTCFLVDIDGTGKRLVIPTINLAAIQRGGGKALLGAHTPDLAIWNVIADVAKLNAHAQGKQIFLTFPGEIEFTDPARAATLFYRFYKLAVAEGTFALDLETYVEDSERHNALQAYKAKIRAIGLATKEWSISVLWDLLPSWCLALLKALLLSTKVQAIYHNGLYDRTVLRANGFICNGGYQDTLLRHHAAFPGAAHNLQSVTAQFYGVTPWKSEFRNNEETPEKLVSYCLHHGQGIEFADGSIKQIQDVVRQRLVGPVRTVNADGAVGTAKITDWYRNRVEDQTWVELRTEASLSTQRGLIVTPDHRVMTPQGWRQAGDLTVGDETIISEPRLDPIALGAICGAILGDGSLATAPSYRHRRWEAPRFYLQGGHETSCGFTARKVAALPFLKPCRERPEQEFEYPKGRQERLAGRRFVGKAFTPFVSPLMVQLRRLAPLFLDKGWQRIIDPSGLDLLGPVGWAWWFMDDGCRQNEDRGRDTICLSMARYSNTARETVRDYLRNKFGPKIHFYQDGVLRFAVEEAEAFVRHIAAYTFEEARYKFPHELRDLPPEVRWRADLSAPLPVKILSVAAYTPKRGNKSARFIADTRWCVSVEDTAQFFTPHGLISNCRKDTYGTRKIDVALTVWIQRSNTERAYESDKKMAACASRMHLDGVPVSREENSVLLKQFLTARDEARAKLEDAVHSKEVMDRIWDNLAMEQAKKQRKKDSESFRDRQALRLNEIVTRHAKGKWAWKISANQHIAALLRALDVQLTAVTEKGSTKVNKEILEGLVEIPIVRDILRFRENDKLISTFVWPLFDRTMKDGTPFYGFADAWNRVHPIWSIHKITGRWASSDPVVSNIPKAKYKKLADGSKQIVRPNIRRQYVAPYGRTFVGFDFAQLEARILALLSGDPWLCRVFTSFDAKGKPLDIHKEAARIIWPEFDTLEEYLQKQLRERAKPFEYGAFYGADPETLYKNLLKEGMNIQRADVYKAYTTLMSKLGGVVKFQTNSVAAASQPPFTLTSFLLGRKRIFPMGQVDRNECLNWPIQCAGADIMNSGMGRMVDRLLQYHAAFPILQIHDAAVFECWEDDAEQLLADVIDCFATEHTHNGVTIEFGVDAKIAKSWADL